MTSRLDQEVLVSGVEENIIEVWTSGDVYVGSMEFGRGGGLRLPSVYILVVWFWSSVSRLHVSMMFE